jgi:hypothetical protein
MGRGTKMNLIITCPRCETRIDVSKQMTALVEEERSKLAVEERRKAETEMKAQFRADMEAAVNKAKGEERARQDAERKRLEKQMLASGKEIQRLQEAVETAAAKAKEEECQRQERDKKQLQSQVAAQAKEIQKMRDQQEEKVKALAQERIKEEVERKRVEIDKSYLEQLGKKDLTIEEYRDQLKKVQGKVHELEAKVSQGSAQARGVLVESELFRFLRERMPSDRCEVEKRGQGKRGTDIIVRVRRNDENVGCLVVDDKWANDWGRDWPEKVWGDMQLHGADFAYIAANTSALPEQFRVAGFGLAPSRRAGVRVWVVDRSNLELVLGILMDSVDKILKLAEIKKVYGAGSKNLEQLRSYLTKDYENELREKAKHMSTAIKALNEMHKKVSSEYERAVEALRGYWKTEERVHKSIASCFEKDSVRLLPQIEFTKV